VSKRRNRGRNFTGETQSGEKSCTLGSKGMSETRRCCKDRGQNDDPIHTKIPSESKKAQRRWGGRERAAIRQQGPGGGEKGDRAEASERPGLSLRVRKTKGHNWKPSSPRTKTTKKKNVFGSGEMVKKVRK